jgi:hypothetical protein
LVAAERSEAALGNLWSIFFVQLRGEENGRKETGPDTFFVSAPFTLLDSEYKPSIIMIKKP